MSLQFSPNVNQVLGAFQRVGLNQGQAYQPDQIYQALDQLTNQAYDRDVANQIYEQCTPNQRGQVQIEEFSQILISADAMLKKKIRDTEQQVLQLVEESRDCQRQVKEIKYTQQQNQFGIDTDSSLNLMIKSASGITNSDFIQSYVSISVDNNEQVAQQTGGDKFHPIFNEQFGFQIKTGRENITLSLLIQDRNQKKSLVGQAKIDISQLQDQQVHSLQLQLQSDRQQYATPTIQFDVQWIYNKLKYYQEMISKLEVDIQQHQNDIEDYKRDLFVVQQPFMDNNQRQNLQSSLKPQNSSKVQTNSALMYQQQQNQPQIYKPTPPQQSYRQNQDNIQPQYQGEATDELSDEIYYGFILYLLMIVLSMFQCFARPAYVDILLGTMYLLIICRDCFNPEYLKILGAITVFTVVLDIFWIAIYKNWWNGTDKTLPTWGEAGDPIVRITIVFCIFNMILKTALCYIIFHYYKEAQSNQVLKFKVWQLEFQIGILKQNLFTLDKRLLS
ncbi:unnamed protein product (macronuclear) [Paramecium tetraurelia]|uniref:C2 domain-containing protein n=1 Tax=Paramecium tetraurelia TaxID=5888 RepID=A0CXN1_PARTE|nr:uncharacterized protein GSPATT00011180001 [Paramecium tetraurelia]CAK75548.1 unnamed protein product [Paramecium tetraurelia]|eukprot:XP_001442945.1 hypothetical protein (macronuclear) [Paramecium tetraurelia strain d4-2]